MMRMLDGAVTGYTRCSDDGSIQHEVLERAGNFRWICILASQSLP